MMIDVHPRAKLNGSGRNSNPVQHRATHRTMEVLAEIVISYKLVDYCEAKMIQHLTDDVLEFSSVAFAPPASILAIENRITKGKRNGANPCVMKIKQACRIAQLDQIVNPLKTLLKFT